MPMKHAALIAVLLGALSSLASNTWYVNKQTGKDGNNGQTEKTPFATIQKAIDVADTNDLIIVASGVYSPIVVKDKALEIRGVDGAEKTIIDGGGRSTYGAQLGSYYTSRSKLTGFTIRKNSWTGAMYGILEDCVLSENGQSIYYGGGADECILYRCQLISNGSSSCNGGGAYRSKLYDCVVSNNVASSGGGTYNCDLYNCVVANNRATKYDGGGVDGGVCNFCKIVDNYADDNGGGISYCRAYNCLIKGNATRTSSSVSYDGLGGGAYWSTLINCTVVDNKAAQAGGGAWRGKIYNSIIWGNSCYNGNRNDYNVSEVSCWFTCTTPLQFGDGNISDDPLFDGGKGSEYYLTENSPCVDCCLNAESREASDLDGGRRIRNFKMDMGAFELQQGEVHFGGSMTWFVDVAGDGDGMTQESPAKEIADVLPKAFGGDKIVVAKGVYKPIAPLCMKISIESVDGPEHTIIDGQGGRTCVNFGETEARTESSVSSETNSFIRGFTLCNGYGNLGGDVYGNYPENVFCAGGLFGGFAENCIMSNNFAMGEGGGAMNANLYRCKLIGNMADMGGGAYDCTLNRCLVIENGSNCGGGVYGGSVANSVIASNIASEEGGGTFYSSIVNCTITKNMSMEAAGVCQSFSPTLNSIIWNNTLFDGVTESDYESEEFGNSFEHCCLPNAPEDRCWGCITKDPILCEMADGAYTISARSPCIDAGNTEFAIEDSFWCLGEFDYNGGARIQNGILDIGATEGGLVGILVRTSHEGLGRISGSVAAKEGDYVTVTATQCDSNHKFMGFYVDERPVTSGIEQDGLKFSYRIRVGTKDVMVVAKFGKATYYVNPNGNDDNDGLSISSAKATLQGAYDGVNNGDQIIVTAGKYVGFLANRPIVATIVGESGAANTIIDGGNTQRCVRLSGSHVIMSGFTLVNGYHEDIGGAVEGGEFC